MSDDFTPLGGNLKAPIVNWTVGTNPSTVFVPFPSSGQPSVPEVGYDEGGYGDGGYDSPAVIGVSAPTTNWTHGVTK